MYVSLWHKGFVNKIKLKGSLLEWLKLSKKWLEWFIKIKITKNILWPKMPFSIIMMKKEYYKNAILIYLENSGDRFI